MKDSNKNRYIKIAAMLAIFGNAFLAGLKIVVGLLSGSSALVADGVDSSSDVLISVITLIVLAVVSKPCDHDHPWGHRRAETVATAFMSFVIFFVGAQLIVSSFGQIVRGLVHTQPSSFAIYVAIVSIVGKLLLSFSQFYLGKKADSAILRANAQNMLGDMLVSVGVLIGLVVSHFTGLAVVDKILTILIGMWIIRTAFLIFKETNLELMDGNANKEAYAVIAEAVDMVEGASNPHRARMRKVAGFWDICFDINVSGDCSVTEAHHIATMVEDKIKERLDNVFDIMVHIEPSGDDAVEAFGLSEEDMREEMQNNKT